MQEEISGPPVRGDAGIASLAPFGIGAGAPHHIRDAIASLAESSDQLGYAVRILRQGVCDGCSLGANGLTDDTTGGTHLCSRRLRQLRRHTIGAFTPSDVANVARLRALDPQQLRGLGRIPYPFVYRAGDRGFWRITWSEALDLVAKALRATRPERTAWYVGGGGVTNETAYVLAKTARLLGSANLDSRARIAGEASARGLTHVLGQGAPTCSFQDWIGADLLLLWGTDFATDHPEAAKYVARAKERGTRVVAINPVLDRGLEVAWFLTEPRSALFGTRLIDDYVPVSPGGDLALIAGVAKALLAAGAVERDAIDASTTGFDAFAASVQACADRDLIAASGTTMGQIEWLAQLVARSRNIVSVWSGGLVHGPRGADAVAALARLHLMRGAVGRPNTGLMPLHRHGGPGPWECGAAPDVYPGLVPVGEDGAKRIERHWGHDVPAAPGLSARDALKAAAAGDLDLLYAVGSDLDGVEPDAEALSAALRTLPLRVHQDTTLHPAMLHEPGEAVLVLPAQGRYEQRGGGTVTSAERRIRYTPEIEGHPTIGEARPDFEIPALVASAAHPALEPSLLFASSQAVRAEMGDVMALYAGVENLRKQGDWIQWGGPVLCSGGKFPGMPEQKARFAAIDPPPGSR